MLKKDGKELYIFNHLIVLQLRGLELRLMILISYNQQLKWTSMIQEFSMCCTFVAVEVVLYLMLECGKETNLRVND